VVAGVLSASLGTTIIQLWFKLLLGIQHSLGTLNYAFVVAAVALFPLLPLLTFAHGQQLEEGTQHYSRAIVIEGSVEGSTNLLCKSLLIVMLRSTYGYKLNLSFTCLQFNLLILQF
jgi:hypothetical protein